MVYYLHLPVPTPLSTQIAQHRRRYEGEMRSVPHITVVMPRDARFDRVEDELVAACRSSVTCLAPPKIRLQQLGYFDDFRVIYLAAERTPELVFIHTTLNDAVKPYLSLSTSPHAAMLNPHITIANRLTPLRGQEIWQKLNDNPPAWSPQQWTAETVSLLAREKPEESWRLVASLKFGQKK